MNRKIPLFKVAMSDSVMSTLADTINSGYITQGPKVEEFERQLMSFLGVRHLLTVNSATNGLCLAYRLLTHSNDELHWPGLEDDDLVLSTPLTCFATNAPILTCRTRLNIQWVDVDLNTGNISLDDLESKISPRTKVITFVHWGGNPVDLQRLDLILDQAQVRIGFRPMVIEDCAHAFGAEIHGCKIGNSKNICVFSFQAIKHLTTADGGAITLPTQDMYDRCKLLRWYGIDRDQRNYQYRDFRLENDVIEAGYKYHMNDLNATIGLANILNIPQILAKNRHNAYVLKERLSHQDGIQVLTQEDQSAYWLFSIRVTGLNKYKFIEEMSEKGIVVSQVHNRNDHYTCVRVYQSSLPNLDILERELVCIPVGWWLSENDLDYIADCIKEICVNYQETIA